jgi:hypothetical protein
MSIPNTLTIFINTRIRNYPKIRYEPNMTVPKIKSTNVFFDPLIKLSNSAAKSLPYGAPSSERFTQFFNKNEFNGLIARTISSSYVGQKKVSLIEATRDGYIDNNIRTTLDQLFESNNIFYIKDKPYTVYSYNWTKGDWKVDTKSFEKEFAYIPYGMNYSSYYRKGTGKLSNSQASRELKKLMEQGEELVNGPVVEAGYSKFKKDEKGKIIPDKPSLEVQTPQEKKEVQKQKEENFIKKIESLPVAQQSLFRDLIKVDLIESPDKANFTTSPLTQLVLYQDKDSLKREVEGNLQLLGPSYNEMNDANTKYLKKNTEFDLLLGNISFDLPEGADATQTESNLMTDKGKYDKLANSLKDKITAYTSKESINKKTLNDIISDTKLKNSLISIIQQLVDLKKKMLNSFIKLIEIFNESVQLLNKYYLSIVKFYSELKKIKYKAYEGSKDKKSIFILFLLMIDFDIESFTYLSQITLINDDIFFKNMKSKIEISNKNMDKTTFVEKLKIYYESKNILSIEKNELDVCIQKIIQIKELNTMRLLSVSYNKTDIFLNVKLKNFAFDRINAAKDSIKLYSEIQEEKSLSQAKLKELIKTNPILKKKIIDSLDIITLYSKVSLITMARGTVFITSKLNLSNIFYRFLIEIKNYYVNIFSQITGTRNYNIKQFRYQEYKNLLQYLPIPIFFENKENLDLLVEEIIITEKSIVDILDISRPSLQMRLASLSNEYKNKLDDFVPKLTDSGIVLNCRLIINPNNYNFVLDRELNTPLTNFEKQHEWFTSQITQNNDDDQRYDLRTYFLLIEEFFEKKFTPQEKSLYKKSIDESNYFLENFSVCINPESPGDSIFAAVANAFNGQLFFEKKQSANKYAVKDGPMKGYFSPEGLRNAVSEEFNEDDIVTFGIKNFKNYKNEPETSYNRKGFNFLFEGSEFIGNDLQLLKEKMKIPVINGGLFYNPKIIIQKLMQIFKISIVIIKENISINLDSNSEYNIKFEKGAPVKFGNEKGIIDKVNSDGTVKILGTNFTYSNVEKSAISEALSLYYSFNCAFNEDVFAGSDLDPNNLPIIFLIEKNSSLMPDYGLLYVDKNEISELESDSNPELQIKRDEINNIIDEVINDLQVQPGLNNKETIQTCPNETSQEVLQQQPFLSSNLPEQLNGFSVVKTVGDGTCALHSILLMISQNYRKLDFKGRDDGSCYDDSQIRSEVGKRYRVFLKANMRQLFEEEDTEGFLFENISPQDNTPEKTQEILLNEFSESNGYINVNIFQYFANYFDINILVYDSVQRRFIPFYINNIKNNKRWGIVYQTRNHFSAVCKKSKNGTNKFLFEEDTLDEILDSIQYNDKPGVIDLEKLEKAPPFNFEEEEDEDDDEDENDNSDLVKYVFINQPIILKFLNILNCTPKDLISPESRSNNNNNNSSGASEGGGLISKKGGDSAVPKSSYSNVNTSGRFAVDNDSKLSYYVIIDLELYPGKEGIPVSQRAVLGCQTRYEKIRQAYANLFGLQYRPNEFNSSIYTPPPKKSKEEDKDKDKDKYRYRYRDRDIDADTEDRYTRSRRRMPYYPRDYTRKLNRYPYLPREYYEDRRIEE